MRIPRVIHQIWVGPAPFPDEYATHQETWRTHNTGWELHFWRDDNLPPGLTRPEVYDSSRTPWERADILRLEVVNRFGGVHVDADFECLRPIEPLLDDSVEFFIGYRKPGHVNGALFGAVAGHPLLVEGLTKIQPRADGAYDKDATGPKFLEALLTGREGVRYFDPPVFYPRTAEELEQAYATHHRARGWKDEEGLRRSLAKAEKRLLEAQGEALEWRRKYEAAEAELERLRSRERQA
jgi:inositol phosphorylceramide mannosyltransferase catalytic subunit